MEIKYMKTWYLVQILKTWCEFWQWHSHVEILCEASPNQDIFPRPTEFADGLSYHLTSHQFPRFIDGITPNNATTTLSFKRVEGLLGPEGINYFRKSGLFSVTYVPFILVLTRIKCFTRVLAYLCNESNILKNLRRCSFSFFCGRSHSARTALESEGRKMLPLEREGCRAGCMLSAVSGGKEWVSSKMKPVMRPMCLSTSLGRLARRGNQLGRLRGRQRQRGSCLFLLPIWDLRGKRFTSCPRVSMDGYLRAKAEPRSGGR